MKESADQLHGLHSDVEEAAHMVACGNVDMEVIMATCRLAVSTFCPPGATHRSADGNGVNGDSILWSGLTQNV